MCGINGFNWADKSLIEAMNKKIEHRGKDDNGSFVSEDFSLGHQRLSIIDLSSAGHQPMQFKNLTLVYNGEIYNFKEIRSELEKLGYKFDSSSDSEVLLKSYHAWGEDCLQKFNGMFAFAVWDSKKNNLFLARDRIGIKTLFYYQKGNKFIFSSEIKAILKYDGVDKEIIPDRISFIYKMSCLPGSLTMFKNIFQFPAASFGIFDGAELKIKKYWQVDDFTDITNKVEIKAQIRSLVEDSIEKRMISDVPLGVFLSGGTDSNVIASLSRKFSNQKIKTFSIGFEVDQESDKYNADFNLARKTAKYFDTDHHELYLKKGQALEYMKYMAENLDMPNSMTTAIPSFFLSRQSKDKVSVVLGGDGGDELFGGYPRYQLSLAVSKWQKLPKSIRSVVPYELLGRVVGKKDLASRLNIENKVDRYIDLKLHQDKDATSVFKNNIYKPEIVRDYLQQEFFDNIPHGVDFEKYFMDVDRRTWLVDHSLIRTDKTTMNFSLEERVPLLDHRLVELAAKIPTKYKLDSKGTKNIFKETFSEDLPSFLFDQPKMGWLSPAAKWLRFEMKDFAYEVLSDNFVSGTDQYYDLKMARKMLDEHIDGTRYNLHLIWILISFQMWYRQIIKA